ncbi:MAG: carbohydrate-binding domain-containing protein [Bacteroidales bacterium]|nr:carbohydrate-binding domain-containing protein [Lentimicrobiaceae bacterium]MDD5693982.1 carbohydrate-binding domain-containing protein [Bacteroidales bacterium]
MKMKILLFACLVSSLTLFAQEKIYIHRSDRMTLGVPLAMVDSIYFTTNGATSFFRIGDTLAQIPVAEIDSISFGPNSSTVSVEYNGSEVSVCNPLAFEGITVSMVGTDVTVYAVTERQDISYSLTGTATDGMFKIYSAQPFNLLLNGVNITNADGPAINIQSGGTVSVILGGGITSTLTDGLTYAVPPSGEDQDGAFFSESDLVFSGTGSLTINGLGTGKHGLSSDDAIEVNDGSITITSSTKDGIHAGDGLLITGGTISVTSSGDGIDGDEAGIEITGGSITTTNNSDDVKGISCDDELLVSGGAINITVTGDQSKGMKSKSPITLSGGTITIHNSGDAVLEASGSGYDPSYCTAIKSDEDITISGAEISIVCSGLAGKGISSDASIIMTSGSVSVTSSGNGATYTNTSGVKDAYVSTCFSTDGNLTISGGTVTTSSSGSGGKGFSTDGSLTIGTASLSPTIHITTTGARIYISGSGQNANYAEAKAVKSDSDVLINNGNIIILSADDGIKSETSIEINNALITINNSVEGLEAPYITIHSGNVHILSSDDCINTTFGNGGEGDDGSLLTISGGRVVVNTTGGDGLDGNGDMLFTGGTIIVHGPPNDPEMGMDYNGTCNMDAGFLVMSGPASPMLQAPSNSSDQYCLKITTYQTLTSSTLFHIQDASGNNVLTFQPVRNYKSIVFSSSALQNGATYSIYTGGTCNGTNTDGLYTGGTYSGGTHRKTFTINSKITSVNF